MVEFSYENSSPLKLLENMEGPVRCGKDLCICQSLWKVSCKYKLYSIGFEWSLLGYAVAVTLRAMFCIILVERIIKYRSYCQWWHQLYYWSVWYIWDWLAWLCWSIGCKTCFCLLILQHVMLKWWLLYAAGCPFRLSLPRELRVVRLMAWAVLMVVDRQVVGASCTRVPSRLRASKHIRSVVRPAAMCGHCSVRQRPQPQSELSC